MSDQETIDNRPDWQKAAAYEAHFFRQEFAEFERNLQEATKRIAKAREWYDELCKTLDNNLKGNGDE